MRTQRRGGHDKTGTRSPGTSQRKRVTGKQISPSTDKVFDYDCLLLPVSCVSSDKEVEEHLSLGRLFSSQVTQRATELDHGSLSVVGFLFLLQITPTVGPPTATK